MRRLLRWLGRGVLALLVLAVLAIAAGVLFLRTDRGEAFLLARIRDAVAAAGGRLEATHVHLRSLGRLVLDDVLLSFRGRSMLRAEQVTIAWNPIPLAWGVVRVETLSLERPRVRLVRRGDGWGFPEREHASSGSVPRIRLRRVRVADGRVAIGLEDGGKPTRLVLREVNGEAGARIGPRGVEVDVEALRVRPAGVVAPPVALRGGVIVQDAGTTIDAQLATDASTLALALVLEPGERLRLEASSPRLAATDLRRVLPSWKGASDVALSLRAAGPRDALDAVASIDAGPAIALRAMGTVDAAVWPPRVDLDVAGSHVEVARVGRVEAGHLTVRGGGEPLAARVDGTLVVAGGRLEIDGRVETARGLAVRTTFAAGDVEPWIGRAGAVRGTARFAEGRLHVAIASAETAGLVGSGSIDASLDEKTAHLDARVHAADVPERGGHIEARIAGLGGSWQADVTLEAADPRAGRLRAEARIVPAAPGATAEVGALVVTPPGTAPWRLARPATLRWDGRAVATDDLTLVRGGNGRLRVHGRVRPAGGTEALDLAIDAQAVDVSGFGAMLPSGIESIEGRIDGALTVRGAFAAPVVDGEATLVASSARVVGIGTLEDVRIRLRGRSGEMLAIESLEAHAGDGTITGAGEIGLGGASAPVRAQLRLRGIPVQRRPLYRGVVGGRVTVAGTLGAPRLDAALRVPRGVIRPRLLPEEGANLGADPTITVIGEPETEPAPSKAAALGPVAIHATVALGDDVHIRRSDAEIRLAGTLTLDKQPGEPLRLRGPIELAEGWYAFKGRRFDIRSGTIRFTGAPSPDPELQIRARYRTPGYEVWVDVGGVASAPTLTLTSEPPLGEADVLAVLLFGRPASQLAEQQQDVVGREAQSVTLAYVAPALEASARKVLPLDRLEVSGQQVEVGRYVTQDVFISLAQDLTERGGQSIGVEYDVTRRTSLKLSTSSRGSGAIDFFWRRRY